MSDTHDIDSEQLTLTLRAATALGLLPVGGNAAGEDLLRWLGAASTLPDSETFITIDGGYGHATAVVGGPSAGMIKPLGDHLGMVDASDAEVARAQALGGGLAPDAVSLWVEADASGLAVGYALHGAMDIGAALESLPDNDARDALAGAIEALGLEVVSELRTTVGMEPVATFVRMPLPATVDALAAMHTIAQAIDVPAFDDGLVTLMLGRLPGAELIVGLNDDGVCAFAVSTDAVELETALGLLEAFGGDAHRLAMFEGALGSEGPRGAMVLRDAEGEHLRLTYAVTTT